MPFTTKRLISVHAVEGAFAQNLSCSDSMMLCLHPACEYGYDTVLNSTFNENIQCVPYYVAETNEQVFLMVAEA